jgi:hypothetical protein
MLIKEIIIGETVLGMPVKPSQPASVLSTNKEPVVLSPQQQARAVALNHKRKIAQLIAKKQAAERQQALSKVSAADNLQAFIQSNNFI